MSCEHTYYRATTRDDGAQVRTCECGQQWTKHPGELHFTADVAGATALALLTPRDERTLPQRALLGFT